jgi:hypothetical protein
MDSKACAARNRIYSGLYFPKRKKAPISKLYIKYFFRQMLKLALNEKASEL